MNLLPWRAVANIACGGFSAFVAGGLWREGVPKKLVWWNLSVAAINLAIASFQLLTHWSPR